jgi:hypothetical protein
VWGILLRLLKDAILDNETDRAQQEQVQNEVQCSVSLLCSLCLMGAETFSPDLTTQSSLSPQGKQNSPNK